MNKEKDEGARSFSVLLQQIADGEAHSEASEKMHEVIQECENIATLTNGSASGELTLKVKVKVDARGVAAISYDVIAKKPKHKKPTATMWVTKGGNLTPENPKQVKLPLQEVPAAQVADVSPAEREARNI